MGANSPSFFVSQFSNTTRPFGGGSSDFLKFSVPNNFANTFPKVSAQSFFDASGFSHEMNRRSELPTNSV